jgi:tRNA(fMet)-specific endonuclease VapC
LLDTDLFSLYQQGHPRVVQQVLAHLTHQLALSIITIEEQLVGWQTALGRARDDLSRANIYRRMAQTVQTLSGWSVIPFSVNAMTTHADLIRQRLNVGSNDLKIAAIALDVGAIVVTRNVRDFNRVPGLTIEDWSL